jgi:hypothetical protein
VTSHEAEQHEAALVELLTDAADPRGAFEASPLAQCALCREIARDHFELTERLAGLGAVERAALAEAEVAPPVAGAAEQALRDHIASSTADRSRRPLSSAIRWIALAAAALLVAALWMFWSPSTERDPRLGSGETGALPQGPDADFSHFTWSVPLPPGGWYEVVVFGAESQDDFEKRSRRLLDNQWNPSDHASWPRRIRWRLDVYRAPDSVDSFYFEAQRSP